MDVPLISVVTVVKNGERHLRQTIESVLAQSYPAVEYIVIDGGSTDGTMAVLSDYRSRIARLVSEPDTGIYDGMNKGIRLASGDLVGLQNSDDFYEAGAFEAVGQAACRDPGAVIYGYQRVLDAKGERETRCLPHQRLLDHMIPHSTCFVPRVLYERFGGFDSSFRIGADYDLMLRFMKHGVPFCRLERVLSSMRRGGISTRQGDLARLEVVRARHKNGFVSDAAYRKHRILYLVRRLLARR